MLQLVWLVLNYPIISGPYSGFAVGAALKTTTGEIFTGARSFNWTIQIIMVKLFSLKRMQRWERSVQPIDLRRENCRLQSCQRRFQVVQLRSRHSIPGGFLHISMRCMPSDTIRVCSIRHNGIYCAPGAVACTRDLRPPTATSPLPTREIAKALVVVKYAIRSK